MTVPTFDRLLPSEATTVGYLLRLSRPRFWSYLAGPAVLGAVYAAKSPAELVDPLTVASIAYFLVPANVFLYGVNDVFDAKIDTENPKKDDREVRYRGSRLVIVFVVLTAAIGLAFVPLLPRSGAAAMVAFLGLSVGYSAPPIRFKTVPFLDSVSNGLYVLPGVVTFVAIAGTTPPGAAIAGGWLWTMAMHTFSAIPDIDPDRAAGVETTATRLGERRTYAYCGCCWFAAAGVFGAVHPFFAIVLGAYPVVLAWVAVTSVSVDRVYWWFPTINTVVGTTLTLGGLWVMTHG